MRGTEFVAAADAARFATDTDKARCVRDATADAVTKIDRPALSTVYNMNNKTSVPSGPASQSR
jgi:hypothetical protein